MVVADIGVEIGAPAIHGQLAQKPGFRKLMHGIVDGGERDRHIRGHRLLMQTFRSDMTVSAREQECRQCLALPRRA